ncbi:hypothetical protein ACWGCW_37885, partial [Streptomyces sp. NPDC054933]
MTEPHKSDPRRRRYAVLGAAALAVAGGLTTTYWQADASPHTSAAATTKATADWVAFSGGKLSYRTDAQGNRVPDFSSVGYHGGGGGGGGPAPPRAPPPPPPPPPPTPPPPPRPDT